MAFINNLQTIKDLLEIDNDEKDIVLKFLIDLVQIFILNYCNISSIPNELNNLLIYMVIELYRKDDIIQNNKEVLKSFSQGDFSISFENQNQLEVFKNYTNQLDLFRKAGW